MRRHTRQRSAESPAPIDASHASALPGVEDADVSLLDVIDHVLNQGIVISGEITLGVADVDLIYIRLLALICSSDRVAGGTAAAAPPRARRARRVTRAAS